MHDKQGQVQQALVISCCAHEYDSAQEATGRMSEKE